MLPQRRRGRFKYRRRHGIVQDDVAMLVPEGEIGRRQHWRARFDRGEPTKDFLRAGRPATAALMRATRSGSTPPVVATTQRSNASKLGASTVEIAEGLFEPEPAGMDDQFIEMAVVHGCRRKNPRRLAMARDHSRLS